MYFGTRQNAEFGRSVFENARVCFRLWEFRQDLPDSRNMIVAQHGLHLKNFQVRIFFCAFLPRIWHNFHWDVRFSEVQYNGGAAWDEATVLSTQRPKGILPPGRVIWPLSRRFTLSQWWSLFLTTVTVFLSSTLNEMKWYLSFEYWIKPSSEC